MILGIIIWISPPVTEPKEWDLYLGLLAYFYSLVGVVPLNERVRLRLV